MDDAGFELVDGELVEVPMSAISALVANNLAVLLGIFLADARLGFWFPQDTALSCWPLRANHFRKPDGMFFAKGRFPHDTVSEGPLTIAPDIALEVVSTHDAARTVETKVNEYLEVGVRLVWVCYPDTSTIYVYRAGSPAAMHLGPGDTLDGGEVLPGFSAPVAAIFETTL